MADVHSPGVVEENKSAVVVLQYGSLVMLSGQSSLRENRGTRVRISSRQQSSSLK